MRNDYRYQIVVALGIVISVLNLSVLQAQQIEVTNTDPFTPINLINNVFLGDGVDVLNVTYEGPPQSVAFFKDGQIDVGLERGVVMTTGLAVTEDPNLGVNATGRQNASVDNGSTISDPDLSAIASGQVITNVVKYTITFVPISDTLRFRYTFASEEYPEYVCSQYNDIFGFFISGPGINGPYTNGAENIALIPGTDLPVRINNVNPGVIGTQNASIVNCQGDAGSLDYSEFYNSNFNSDNFPVYDGITDVFVAEAVVEPCEVYTIKLIIADVGDRRLDSGVFLEAKSFGTGSVQAEATAVTIDGAIAEGCEPGFVTFSLPAPLDYDFILDYNIGGTAQNGVDYETFPTNLVIPAGETELNVPVQAISDGIPEPRETVTFDVEISQCTRRTYTISIDDARLLPPSEWVDAISLCTGESVQLQGQSPVTIPPPPSFTSTEEIRTPFLSGSRYSDIVVSGVFPEKLGPGVIKSVCIDRFEHRWIDDMDFYLIGPDGQYLELTTDNGGDGGNGNGFDYYINTCFTPTATQPINFPGPFAPASAVPFTGEFLPEGNWSDFWDGDKNTNGTYQLLFTDDALGNRGTLYGWTITFENIYDISYTWSPADGLSCTDCPNPVAQPSQSTEYTLTIRDSYGCEEVRTVNISVPDESSRPQVICSSVRHDAITIGWDAVANYDTYEVSVDGANWTSVGPNLEYTEDGLDFEQTVNFQVRAIGDCVGLPASISCTTPACSTPVANVATTDATCATLADGSIAVQVTEGVAPFTYELSGQTNDNGVFTDLAPGEYSVMVTDANQCPATFGFTIGSVSEVELQINVLQEISCDIGDDGSISVSATGAGGNYSYAWSDGQTTPTASSLPAGEYTVTVTAANGCSQTASYQLDPPTEMEVSLSATETRCGTPSNGTASLVIDGGIGPFDINWGHNAAESGTELSGLSAGVYEVTVTDAEGCALRRNVEVTEAEGLVITAATTSVSCAGGNNGTIELDVTGGEGSYTYQWSQGGASDQLTGLAAGSYTVTVMDAFNCTNTATVTVDELPPLEVAKDFTPALCAGVNTGFIDLKVTGGTPPYDYNWSNGSSGKDITGLGSGNYSVTITDGLGCQLIEATTIQEAVPMQADFLITDIDCNGEASGALAVALTGGQSPFVYNWSNGATGSQIQDLPAGEYSLTVTDAGQCETVVSVTLQEPPFLDANLQALDITCAGGRDGRIEVQATGGTPAYSYSLDGSNFKTSGAFIGLTAGDYQVFVRDANGCTITPEAVSIIEPEPLIVSLGENINVEYGDTLLIDFLDITGGTGMLTYSWSPSDSSMLSCIDCPNPTVIVKEQTSFKLLVRDEKGCTADDIITIFVNKFNPVMVPTGFTPNGDGQNDLLHVHGKANGTRVVMFRIYDRWGELLHEDGDFDLNDRSRGWDGTFRGQPLNGGVYIWHIEVEYPDGMRETMAGSTTLIR